MKAHFSSRLLKWVGFKIVLLSLRGFSFYSVLNSHSSQKDKISILDPTHLILMKNELLSHCKSEQLMNYDNVDISDTQNNSASQYDHFEINIWQVN